MNEPGSKLWYRARALRDGTLYQVHRPGVTAGFVCARGQVIAWAPILTRWVQNRPVVDALDLLRQRGWQVMRLDPR